MAERMGLGVRAVAERIRILRESGLLRTEGFGGWRLMANRPIRRGEKRHEVRKGDIVLSRVAEQDGGLDQFKPYVWQDFKSSAALKVPTEILSESPLTVFCFAWIKAGGKRGEVTTRHLAEWTGSSVRAVQKVVARIREIDISNSKTWAPLPVDFMFADRVKGLGADFRQRVVTWVALQHAKWRGANLGNVSTIVARVLAAGRATRHLISKAGQRISALRTAGMLTDDRQLRVTFPGADGEVSPETRSCWRTTFARSGSSQRTDPDHVGERFSHPIEEVDQEEKLDPKTGDQLHPGSAPPVVESQDPIPSLQQEPGVRSLHEVWRSLLRVSGLEMRNWTRREWGIAKRELLTQGWTYMVRHLTELLPRWLKIVENEYFTVSGPPDMQLLSAMHWVTDEESKCPGCLDEMLWGVQ
jgi:hypothetical protein